LRWGAADPANQDRRVDRLGAPHLELALARRVVNRHGSAAVPWPFALIPVLSGLADVSHRAGPAGSGDGNRAVGERSRDGRRRVVRNRDQRGSAADGRGCRRPSNAPEWYVNIESVEWLTPPPTTVGSRMIFIAHFLGRRLAYTYEVVK
jgi:hypothetical protein